MAGHGDTRYKALDHPIRRKIIQLLATEPQTYSRLLEKLGIESGHLAYHIRNLEELLEKDPEGNYKLNKEGEQAYKFLTGDIEPAKIPQSSYATSTLMIVSLLIIIIMGVILIGAPTRNNEQHITALQEETIRLNLEAIDTVYEIFEDWEIPREHWTGLLLNIVKIKSNLEELHTLTGEESLSTYAEQLETYESELSNVIIVGDPGYMSLTVEKRYLIRELHTILLEIDEALVGL
ncbi:MAG: winged helix-turn-helix domain-containing protein [Candidatus Bathyarchaeota archaeon]|nr:winged helix-turn-helix domain-containing protein [Candidatus Bathyarchaeota archaeon]